MRVTLKNKLVLDLDRGNMDNFIILLEQASEQELLSMLVGLREMTYTVDTYLQLVQEAYEGKVGEGMKVEA